MKGVDSNIGKSSSSLSTDLSDDLIHRNIEKNKRIPQKKNKGSLKHFHQDDFSKLLRKDYNDVLNISTEESVQISQNKSQSSDKKKLSENSYSNKVNIDDKNLDNEENSIKDFLIIEQTDFLPKQAEYKSLSSKNTYTKKRDSYNFVENTKDLKKMSDVINFSATEGMGPLSRIFESKHWFRDPNRQPITLALQQELDK